MKPFMENPCMHPYCQETRCKNCYFFQPKIFGIKVPKFIGAFLFYVEGWIMYLEYKKKNYF